MKILLYTHNRNNAFSRFTAVTQDTMSKVAEKKKKKKGEEVEEKEEEVTLVALFYKYCNVKNPREQVEIHRKKCEGTFADVSTFIAITTKNIYQQN